ncbi:glycine cleavage system aminomethyltransferase GcvT [Ketogulonicigenium vulgare]|uniref:glycine cleavage system aminomethyltransferase GcvT n=1 Tax=Ketogulonicigenium vulgare TaxID=92945 RepID=UPI002358E1F7|nr:glycine cleavage system aminomethyltransferase GcvT [Ketogulonicigenium vulgare]
MADLNTLRLLPLDALHQECGAKMCPFAGYQMPINFPAGVMKEHLHTRSHAGLFDVSHMGQVLLQPKGDMATVALAFEALMPVDVLALQPGRQRYGLLTNAAGGILDDLMFANRGDHYYVVVNAACKEADIAHLTAHLSDVADVIPVTDRALLALQGPEAEAVLEAIVPGTAAMRFMDVAIFGDLWISRSGYTGEDGYEISLPEDQADAFARKLLADPRVLPIGLGARDSLRLEAGMCLYGHDIDTTTSPVEAGLTWAIQKSRRTGGARAGGFPGAARILHELEHGPARLRVGLLPEGRAPLREGVPLVEDGAVIGQITSGGFSPSGERPIAMGYVPTPHAAEGTPLTAELRGRAAPATVTALPFQPNRYKR